MIDNIVVLDYYGGPHYVSITDYYNANYDWDTDHVKLIDNEKGTTFKRKSIKMEKVKDEDEEDELMDDNTVFIKIHKEIDIIKKRQ